MSEITKDTWKLGEHEFSSRFILGSGKYSLELIDAAVKEAKAEIVTMALRRANEGGVANILDYIPQKCDTASKYIRGAQCGGGSSYCKIVKTDQRK